VFSRQVSNAFCAVRHPADHASAACGMGFCLFNNVALAARHAQRAYHAERVLIADWDVHHGNGTQDIFMRTARALLQHASVARYRAPARAPKRESARARVRPSIALCRRSGGSEVAGAFREMLLPAADDFRPT